jgi:O-acetyl-ADP-ribose deacetylase (regulator of RNase III)
MATAAEVIARDADITQLDVDVIVNAANARLQRGGGVDGAIHRAAGPALQPALDALGGCPTGSARLTPGFNLKARHIVHAVGPIWQGGRSGEAQLLGACYRAALDLAAAVDARSIAFPAISTGIYGYPLAPAAAVAVGAVRAFLAERTTALDRVIFACFGPAALEAFAAALARPPGS